MADNETIAALIAWLRKPREGENAYLTLWRDEIADRLEAAYKRDTKELRVEIERLKEERNYSGVRERKRLKANGFAIVPKEQLERGDAAKLREALEAIDKNTDLLDIAEDIAPKLHPSHSFVAVQIRKIVRAALDAPPRNCDVGTAEEQIKRWQAFCNRYDDDCTGCPCEAADTWDNTGCFAKWAQMPYEEGGAK